MSKQSQIETNGEGVVMPKTLFGNFMIAQRVSAIVILNRSYKI